MGDKGNSNASVFWFLLAFSQIYLGIFALGPTYEFLQVMLSGSGFAFLVPAIYFLLVRVRADEFNVFGGRYNQSETSMIYRDESGDLKEYHGKQPGTGWMKIALLIWFGGMILVTTFM